MAKNPPCSAGDSSSISGQGTKIPHTSKQLGPHMDNMPQLEGPWATGKISHATVRILSTAPEPQHSRINKQTFLKRKKKNFRNTEAEHWIPSTQDEQKSRVPCSPRQVSGMGAGSCGNVPGFATCFLADRLVTLGKSFESPKPHFFSCELGLTMLAS